MLCHSLGAGWEVIFALQHFIAFSLDLVPACKPQVIGIALRAINSRREQSIAAMKRKISSPKTNVWRIFFCQPKANLS